MDTNGWLDGIQQRVQAGLNQAKQDRLAEKSAQSWGPAFQLASGIEGNWLDHVLEFERKYAQARMITVRERLGNPEFVPHDAIPDEQLDDALLEVLALLHAEQIAVDFLGDVELREAYRFVTETLPDFEIDDIRIDGMLTHFAYSTPEYDVLMGLERFVRALFAQDRGASLEQFDRRPFFDVEGRQIPARDLQTTVAFLWEQLPRTAAVTVEALAVTVLGKSAQAKARIAWPVAAPDSRKEVESTFRLEFSALAGWEVVQTTFLDDLLAYLSR